jgi:TPP-dependent pyruvate/acetoin dehydrogenase alpha subunit
VPADLWALYALMKRSRLFEEAVTQLWNEGLISGEMHLGTGEEAIVAGILSHIQPGDALALDHRGTPPMIMNGVDPTLILRELLGQPGGLCRGQGGHMHLFSKEHLIASSGIVGASGPAAAGFGLAAQYLRPDAIAVAFFGEGAINQGMLMESMNLAAVWNLPVLFVCKDDGWAITSVSRQLTRGSLADRTRGLGLDYLEVDGLDVVAVWEAARAAITKVRAGEGPAFLHAHCVHLEAHFLGYQLIRVTRHPVQELPRIVVPLIRSFLKPGGTAPCNRIRGLNYVNASLFTTLRDPRQRLVNDPVWRTRNRLLSDQERLLALETTLKEELANIVAAALQENVS